MKTKVLKPDLIYPELSYQIVGALFNVFRELGGNLLEKQYQRAVRLELKKIGLNFKEQVQAPLKYLDQSIGSYYLDFLIDDKIILEIKKDQNFSPRNIKQLHAYLKVLGLKLGILANFTRNGLRFKRIVNLKQ